MSVIDHLEIRKAANIILRGDLVGMPTETVYGLAADATNDKAINKIYQTKGRPSFNPLIIHVTGHAMAEKFVEIDPLTRKLMDMFWPGALTFIMPRKQNILQHNAISMVASAGLETLAVRAPNHPVAQALLGYVGRPLAAPSANPSGTISPTCADHVRASFDLGPESAIGHILDGGPCKQGVESTIIKIANEQIILLRPGSLAREALTNATGLPVFTPQEIKNPPEKLEAPGNLASHYAPNAILRLDVKKPKPDEVFIAFGVLHADTLPHRQVRRAI